MGREETIVSLEMKELKWWWNPWHGEWGTCHGYPFCI